MKSKAEYQRRWCEGLRLGYMVNSRDPSFPRCYAKAMMREDKRKYWAKKHRKLGPSYNRTIEVYLGKRIRAVLIDQYYNRSLINMWPTNMIHVDLGNEIVIPGNRILYEELLRNSNLDEKE
jgi:hypothetical protein